MTTTEYGITVNDGNIEEANDPTIDDSSNDEDGDEDEDYRPTSSATTGIKHGSKIQNEIDDVGNFY